MYFAAILLCCSVVALYWQATIYVAAPCTHACTFGDDICQEDVQPTTAHQAPNHNVQVVFPGVYNLEWLTTSTSTVLGLLLNVDVGLEDVKFKAFQASFIVSQSKHNVEVVILGDNRESLTTTTSSALGLMFNIDVGQEDVKLKAFQAAFIASQSMHHVQVVTSVVKSEWLTTTTSSALGFPLNVDDVDDSYTTDEYKQNNSFGVVDESVGLTASFENRTTMQARKAWPGQNGQFGKARGHRKGGSGNTFVHNTFVHNGGGYDSETFISIQLFAAGIESNPGPAGGILSDTGEESKGTSTNDGGSSCTPHTDPLNTVQRKRSRADRGQATEKRAKQRLADVNLLDQQRLADEVRN